MNSANTLYHISKQIKDDKFNVELLQHYNLSLQIGPFDFRIAVVDNRDHRCLIMESYHIPEFTPTIEALTSIFEDHHFLKAGFWNSVKVAFKNNKFSFIPTTLFDKENLREYLDINAASKNDSFFYYKHDKLKAINVFAAPTELVVFFNRAYPGTTLHFLHQESLLIEGINKYQDYSFSRNMALVVEEGAISVLVHQDEELLYCNRFEVRNPEKIVQYIMTVMHELQLDQYDTRTTVWGDVEATSPTFEIMQNYIFNISFGGKQPIIHYGYVFDEIEDHQYFDLFNINLCD